ncbi:MAG: hypothetical protein RL757_2558 [Bacteroidota bacterium]|jgi:hypothetical protein
MDNIIRIKRKILSIIPFFITKLGLFHFTLLRLRFVNKHRFLLKTGSLN